MSFIEPVQTLMPTRNGVTILERDIDDWVFFDDDFPKYL